jgi:[ribosomal protein S5]-alanine N-acetyltransferase
VQRGKLMTDALVKTERTFLRSLRLGDAESIAALMTPDISRWLTNFPLPYTTQMAQQRLERIREAGVRGQATVLGIERKADGAFMGWFGVYRTAERSIGGLGYWLGEPFQRSGYMSEAAPLALDVAANEMKLSSFEAYIHPENEGSLKIVNRMGFKQAGERFVYASARDREERCLRFVRDV